MKNIAIIPARGGSKRLPKKNILSLGDIPLIAHSILYAKANRIIDSVYVSTDDDEIDRIAVDYGAKVIKRPAAISGDEEPTVSALKHVLENCGETIENVFLLQPTNPLRPKRLIEECFEIFQNQHAECLFTVSRNFQKFGKITDNKFIPFNYKPGQRSQDLDPLFFENGLLYICKADVIFRNEIISEGAFPFVTDHIFGHIDIDTKEDFDYAEYVLKTHKPE